ncbi:GTPase [Candidatus Parabeggiatoa sp. HSG14]|uniref:GTPase n=1 Tax=Candidatus Parabeggiatoa sp. HSG14 TaxID=3055593 RepID=UPI0025A71DAA|nr:50S ribosome-binding GTPase [Thiotrichales bacterium HSG14]
MKQSTFELFKWTEFGNALLERARRELSNAVSEKVQNLSYRIPSTIILADEAIEVVFAGQYSAGKSTILKVITGQNDIETGADITTQEAHTYDWNGVKVTDTPGVHTEIRPDHDEISYRAISNADLFVFVVTNELFDSYLAQHFRKLAIEKDKCHEMMLVVNKMCRCAKGNTPEMQAIIREDIQKVLVSFSLEDFRISFIDAESAIESSTENDSDIAKILYRKSGIESFIFELNRFISDKGLASRYTTSLYKLEQVLQDAMAAESTGDKDVGAFEELQLQKRQALFETREHIRHAVEGKIQRASTHIRQEGREVADLIHASANQEKINDELEAAQKRVQTHTEQLNQDIEGVIDKHIKKLGDRLSTIANSEFAKELLSKLELKIKKANISPEAMSKLKTTGDISQQLGKFLSTRSFTLKEGFSGLFNLNHYSGTATHGAVKSIGNFFGYKFRPWEAVKWTKGIANAGRAFAVVGTVLTFCLQIKEDTDAAQLRDDLRESRTTVITGFNDAAYKIEMHFDKATKDYVANMLTPEFESVDKQLTELREMQQSHSKLSHNLVSLLDETQRMIKELHKSSEEIT